MKESPVGLRFASAAAAVGSSTGAADAMVRRNTLPAGRRLSPAKWDAAGDGFRMRNRAEQSINEAAPSSRELRRRSAAAAGAWGAALDLELEWRDAAAVGCPASSPGGRALAAAAAAALGVEGRTSVTRLVRGACRAREDLGDTL